MGSDLLPQNDTEIDQADHAGVFLSVEFRGSTPRSMGVTSSSQSNESIAILIPGSRISEERYRRQ